SDRLQIVPNEDRLARGGEPPESIGGQTLARRGAVERLDERLRHRCEGSTPPRGPSRAYGRPRPSLDRIVAQAFEGDGIVGKLGAVVVEPRKRVAREHHVPLHGVL